MKNFLECENRESVGLDSQDFGDSGKNGVVKLNGIETDLDYCTIGAFEGCNFSEFNIGESYSRVDVGTNEISFIRLEASKHERSDDVDAS